MLVRKIIYEIIESIISIKSYKYSDTHKRIPFIHVDIHSFMQSLIIIYSNPFHIKHEIYFQAMLNLI